MCQGGAFTHGNSPSVGRNLMNFILKVGEYMNIVEAMEHVGPGMAGLQLPVADCGQLQ